LKIAEMLRIEGFGESGEEDVVGGYCFLEVSEERGGHTGCAGEDEDEDLALWVS
jgi:hypothetical protein